MDTIERAYKDGKAIGYYIPGSLIARARYDTEGRVIQSHTARAIAEDYLSGRCHVCVAELPPGARRKVCLDCLDEQTTLAFAEVTYHREAFDYLKWKQQQALTGVPSADDWKELEEAQSDFHDGVTQEDPEGSIEGPLPPGNRGREDDYYQAPAKEQRQPPRYA